MKLRGLIFDVDGTLAETEREGHRIAFNQVFKKFGLNWDWDSRLYGTLLKISGGKERILYYINHYQPNFISPIATDNFITQLHQLKNQYYLQLLEEGKIPLRPGIARLISEAKKSNLKLGIATTTTEENVIGLLQAHFGAEGPKWFDCIAAGDMVRNKKPASDIYYYCLQKLDLNASQCIAFEDSENGMRAAIGAQIKTIVTVNDYTENENFSGATLILEHLGDPQFPTKIPNEKNLNYVTIDFLIQLLTER
ncbi:HAD family hydrolase [Candidatus Nitrosacidococcus tergens]|uniref:Protein CbbY, plasmid n=1 Tax=Candidatus Nitrosacidococcus tergens TaxID=553981 RepID=A0A7G1Q9G6_9GAMM|nr:HAD family hydrolase [Candidatus Nitrosacidococcus tergens]CAB1275741.1 Protein CbbY, plasmid [Candidatus Nitrosacidococcus tergens]